MLLKQWIYIVMATLLALQVQAQESTTETTAKVDEVKQEAEVKKEEAVSQPAQNGKIEKLQVTGSHIKRVDVEGPSPVLTLDRDYLDKTGYNSVADVLRDTTVSGLGGFRETGLSGGASAGAATTSVRGMGADTILVLLDGKRLPTMGGSATVDLNLIPMAAIERIEILKDGASAIYGSDALGGVINFITKKNYDGAVVSFNHSMPEERGGAKTDITGTWGKSGSKYDVLGVLQYRTNESVGMRDRDYFIPTPAYFSGSGSPGSYKNAADGTWNAGGGADPCSSPLAANGKCTFDYSPYMNTVPDLDQYSALLRGRLELNENLSVYARAIYTHRDVRTQLAPPPDTFTDQTATGGINTRLPKATADAFGLPGGSTVVNGSDPGKDVDVVYRLVEEAGPRKSEISSDSFGISSGVKGYILDSWEWEFSGSYAETKNTNRGVSGYANKQTLFTMATQAIPQFNPFAAPGSKSDISSALYVPQLVINSNIGSLWLQGSGEVAEMAAGPLALAVGVSGNWQTFEQTADAVTASGAQWGGGTSAQGKGRRDFQSAYLEFAVPLLKSLEMQLAGRFDNYSDFGSTFNPKVGFRYKPFNSLMLRGTWGTGFKAPTLENLYEAQTVAYPFGQDPVTSQVAQFELVGGGNQNLIEETSESVNLGFVWQILDNLSFGTDYYTNNQENVVSAGAGNQRLQDIFTAEAAGIDLSKFGIVIVRTPATTGQVDRILAPNLNLAARESKGLEFRIGYNQKLFGDWTLTTIIDHSILLSIKEQPFPGLEKQERVGRYGNPYWRNNVSIGVGNNTFGFNFLVKTIGEQDYSFDSPGFGGKTRDHTELDFQGQYSTSWEGLFVLGVRNVFGTDRPWHLEHQSNGFINTSLYDPFGRTAYLGYTQNF